MFKAIKLSVLQVLFIVSHLESTLYAVVIRQHQSYRPRRIALACN